MRETNQFFTIHQTAYGKEGGSIFQRTERVAREAYSSASGTDRSVSVGVIVDAVDITAQRTALPNADEVS